MGGETLVCHYSGIDGYNKTITGEVLATLSGAASDIHHVHGVLWRGRQPVAVTNSNCGHVFPTIARDEYKMSQHQKDTTGGYVLHRFSTPDVGKEVV